MSEVVDRARAAMSRGGPFPEEMVTELVEKVESQAEALASVRRWMHEGVDQTPADN